jgi:alkanesulfonate monooxygenase SsuD/methylene tetrahydromethanopterin reductase-like flavin-dependent oxidoreductase (luciferase family)
VLALTLAARKAIKLDHLTGGRIALHIITGGSNAEMQRDGDFLGPIRLSATFAMSAPGLVNQRWTTRRWHP